MAKPSPKEAFPLPLPRLFHYSKFKILNSPPLQSGPIKNESGKIVVKQGKK
jgi:hypothetical protein